MKHFLGASLVLTLAASFASAWAQHDSHQQVDALYERGQHELSPSWRGLGKTRNAAVFIHANVRKADNGYLAIWADHELPAPEYFEKEKAYLSTRGRIVVDCKAARVGITDMSYYAEHFGKGAIVATRKANDPEMSEVVPDSMEDQLVKIACAPKPRAKPAQKTKAAKPATD